MASFDYDYLIVGSGLTGLVLAERLYHQNKKILVIDSRPHFGGSCYDQRQVESKIHVPKYGLKYFHTNKKHVYDYLSRFTGWMTGECNRSILIDGKLFPFPINLNSFEMFIGKESTEEKFKEYLLLNKVEAPDPENAEDALVNIMGYELYQKFYKDYNTKRWGVDPKELAPVMLLRHPFRTNREIHRSDDLYQGMPEHGYTRMFESMLAGKNDRLIVLNNADYFLVKDAIKTRYLIYTGPVDKFFDYRCGRLPYRSFNFESVTYNTNLVQTCMEINYPSDNKYTTSTEIRYSIKGKNVKHGKKNKSVVIYEYPLDYNGENYPYYPILTKDGINLHNQYKLLMPETENTTFVGGLSTFQYLNVAETVDQALTVADQLKEQNP